MSNWFLKLSYILNLFISGKFTVLKAGNNFKKSFWKSKFLTYAEWSWALPFSLLQALPLYCHVFYIPPPQRKSWVAGIYGNTACTRHSHSSTKRSCWRNTVHTEWRIFYLKQLIIIMWWAAGRSNRENSACQSDIHKYKEGLKQKLRMV